MAEPGANLVPDDHLMSLEMQVKTMNIAGAVVIGACGLDPSSKVILLTSINVDTVPESN